MQILRGWCSGKPELNATLTANAAAKDSKMNSRSEFDRLPPVHDYCRCVVRPTFTR